MSWAGPVIGAIGSIAGGLLGSSGAKSAANEQRKALERQLALQREMYYSNLGINEPWRATGQGALNNLAQLYGLPYQNYQPATQIAQGFSVGGGSGAPNKLGVKEILKMLKSGQSIEQIAKFGSLKDSSGIQTRVKRLMKQGLTMDQIAMLQAGPMQFAGQDVQTNNLPAEGGQPAGPNMSVFTSSPDYQFRRDEGQRDIGNSFAARGGAFSGNALRGLTDFNSNLAAGEFNNYYNRMANLAGLGQVASNQAGQYGQNYANQGGNAMANIGDARASGIANSANIWGNAIGGAANAFGNYFGNRSPRTPPYVPYDPSGVYGG